MEEQIRLSERIFRNAFPQLTKPQLKVMAQLIGALVKTENFTLSDIASNLRGETDVKHKLKKLQYFLDGIDCNYKFWHSYFSLVLSLPNLRLSKRDKISITINSSNLGPSFRILTACITYKNRPLPLFLKLWNTYEFPVDFLSEFDSLIQSLKELLPGKYNYLFISDDSISSYNSANSYARQDIEYIVRIRPNVLKLKDAIDYTDIKLFPDGVYQGANTDDLPADLETNIAVVSQLSEDGSRSPIYFSSNLTNKDVISQYYTNRMFIEGDLTSLINERKWQKYSKKTPEISRFEKLLIISCLSNALYSSGEENISKFLQHIIVNLTRMKK